MLLIRPGDEAAAEVDAEVGENRRKVPLSTGGIPVSLWSIKGAFIPDILADVQQRERKIGEEEREA